MSDQIVVWCEQGVLTRGQLQAAIGEATAELATDEGELGRLGISQAELENAHLAVQQEGGFIAEGILLAIAIGAGGNLAADAGKGLISAILKRVKERHGDDAVGQEKQPDDSGEKRPDGMGDAE
jgi:hypothetical protein